MYFCPAKNSIVMKKILFIGIMLILTGAISAQNDSYLRVLQHVPDSCNSVKILYLDSLAEQLELKKLNDNHLIDAVSQLLGNKSLNAGINDLIHSWIEKDDKIGVDFTAAAALVNDGLLFIPLNNEKNFEKELFKIIGRKIPCQNIKKKGIKIYNLRNTSLLCMGDWALLDLDGVFFDVPQEQIPNLVAPTCFMESQYYKTMVQKGMTSCSVSFYDALSVGKLMDQFSVFGMAGFIPVYEFMNDRVIFARTEMGKERIRYVREMYHNDGAMTPMTYDASILHPEKLEKLLPYVTEHPMGVVSSFISSNVPSKSTPYIDIAIAMPSFYFLSTGLSDLVGYQPWLVNYCENNKYLLASMVEDSVDFPHFLENFVEKNNRYMDSIHHVEIEYDGEPERVSLINLEDGTEWISQEYGTEYDEQEGMKQLVRERYGDWDMYLIITQKKELKMDGELFGDYSMRWSLERDTAYVLLEGDKFFCTDDTTCFEQIRHPRIPEWLPVERMLHSPVYMINDVRASIKEDVAFFPAEKLEIYVQDNRIISDLHAAAGLENSIWYEIVKCFADRILKMGF